MLGRSSLIKTNQDYCEYALDLAGYKDFRVKPKLTDDFYIILTDYDNLYLTGNHMVQLDNGTWKSVEQLQVSDCLKNIYCGRAFIIGISHQVNTPIQMVSVFNKCHSYNIVNGFHVDQ